MTWFALSNTVPQYENPNGIPYSGAVLKAYEVGTTTPKLLAFDANGTGATVNGIVLNSSGYPAPSGNIAIPHVQGNCKLSLYPTQTDANANTNAIWTVDDIRFDGDQTISIKDFGAVGNGTTDDTQALVAAWAAAIALPYPKLYIPAGTYKISSLAARLQPKSGMTVYGDGMEVSTLYWVDGGVAIPDRFIGTQFGDPRVTNFTIRDIHLKGDNGSNYVSDTHYPLIIYGGDNLNFLNVKVSYSRLMAIVVRDGVNVLVHGCHIEYCARDGISTAGCRFVTITDNFISYSDDDAIACHNRDGIVDIGLVIANNRIRFAQGIKALGVRGAVIANNNLEFCFGQGISVKTSPSGDEGRTSTNVLITGNVIKNNIDRLAIDGLNTTAPYILVSAESAQAGSLAAIPGENVTASGTVINPFGYFYNPLGADLTLPVPGAYGITISNNILMRDIAALAAISSLGYGTFYVRTTGPKDPAITLVHLSQNGILLSAGLIKDVLITGNNVFGLLSGVSIGNTARVEGRISNNIFKAIDNNGLEFGSGNALHHKLYIDNNEFDIDPFMLHANRGANNTWLAIGSPICLAIQNATGVTARNNVFRNTCRISDRFNVAPEAGLDLHGNIAECQPAAINFSTSNKGIGNIIRSSDRVIYKIIDSDPASATYGNLLNTCVKEASVMPASGYYVAGHFVRNATMSMDASNMLVLGWTRLTTGSGHVSGTDWAICNVSHVSPAT